jgi:hypothetical protein
MASQSIRVPRMRMLLSAVIVVLAMIVGFALWREVAPGIAKAPAAPVPAAPAQAALSGEEEEFAAALWPIHSEVKLSAISMSFAGLAYKTDDHDPGKLAEKLQPLADGFKAAAARAQALEAPASMAKVRGLYLEALALYENASAEMLMAARDGSDERLIAAQGMSLRAAEDLLRVSDVLWPGEHKPH